MSILSDNNHNRHELNLSESILREVSVTKSEIRVKSIVESSINAIAVLDTQLRYIIVNQPWLKDYNLSSAEIMDRSYEETSDRQLLKYKAIYQNCLLTGKSQNIEQLITLQSGITKTIRLHLYPWLNEQKQIAGIVVFSEVFGSELTIEPFFELSLDMLCIIDSDGYFKKVNSAFTETLGYSTLELQEKPFLSFVHESEIATTLAEIEKLDRRIEKIKFETLYASKNGSYRRLQWTAIKSPQTNNSIYAVVRDLTPSHELQQQLYWQSKHDSITGLLNRQEFEQKIAEIISRTKITQKQHAFCYLDLDRFKIINDVCGHLVGDELLRKITNLIKQEIAEQDILSRLGGDEFGLLLKYCSLEEAERIAHHIRTKIQEFKFSYQEKNFVLGVSIGIAILDRDSSDFSSLLNAADTACYAAKEQGRNGVRIYHPEDRDLAQQRGERHWISKLNLALEENLFCLYCQKITPLQDNFGIDHYEILLRLIDRQGNLISPMQFIPAAERYDLMPTIDRWVISTFFARYQHHCQRQDSTLGYNPIYTINLSGASINSDRFFTFLKEQFATYKIAPEKICFEITETSAIANLQKAARFITEIKQLGCSFALDDFGSGMSSLNYLKNLPVDYLKIDGNFIKNIVNDPVDRATVECFNRISKVMNIQTIAEFVENDDIIAQLKEIGINYAQGYGIDKPSPLAFEQKQEN